jgi:LysM repeat protein
MDAFTEPNQPGMLSNPKTKLGLIAGVALIGSIGLFMLIKVPSASTKGKPAPTASVAVQVEKKNESEKPASAGGSSVNPGQGAVAAITPALPGLADKAKVPSLAPGKEASKTAQPKGSRGGDAVVRWTEPTAEGLSLLESGKAKEAWEWSEQRRPQLSQQGAKAAAFNDQLTARALAAQGRYADAQPIFKGLNTPGRPAEFAADAQFGEELCKAQGQLESIPSESLKKIVELNDNVTTWGQARAAVELAKRADKNQKTKSTNDEEARELYQHAYLSETLEEPLEKECFERLNALTESLILNPKRATEDPKTVIHKVVGGDSLSKVSKKYGVPITQITHLNKLDPKAALYVGKGLKIIPGNVVLKVDRWRLTATLLIGNTFIKQYPVGIGPGENTPAGSFTVRTKVVNPDWWYNGKKVPYGNPENILGTRWIGFDRDEHGGKAASIGVHGTTIPDSIPGRESKGCVRMKNSDVEELYNYMPQGGTVEIND